MNTSQHTVNRRSTSELYQLVFTGLMAGLAVMMMNIRFAPFPGVPYLKYDLGDIPVLLTTIVAGPLHGLIALLIMTLVEMGTVSISGFWGWLMHFLATGSMVVVLSLIYQRRKTQKSLIIGLIAAGITLVLVMIPMNLLVTPLFTPALTWRKVIPMILPVLLPFNALKALLHGVITFVLFKATKPALTRMHKHF